MRVVKRVPVLIAAGLFLLALFGVGVVDKQLAVAGLCLAGACLL